MGKTHAGTLCVRVRRSVGPERAASWALNPKCGPRIGVASLQARNTDTEKMRGSGFVSCRSQLVSPTPDHNTTLTTDQLQRKDPLPGHERSQRKKRARVDVFCLWWAQSEKKQRGVCRNCR